jgi:hypothetical protein
MAELSAEMRKQLLAYADAITAFATAQFVAYTFLLTHGHCFTLNIITAIWWAAPVGALANGVYIWLVWRCYHAATQGLAQLDVPVWKIQKVRYIILAIDLILTCAIPFGIRHGWCAIPRQFFIDCKGCQ